ncbi:MAG: DUF932 domain-containing protein [Candidatus Thorarchaeota archaeon]|jgi:hypothetical protein
MTAVADKLQEMETHKVKDLIDSGAQFKEHYVHLNDLKARRTEDYKSNRSAGNSKNLCKGTAIEFDGGTYFPSQRFWNSFCSKVGMGTNIFNLFDHSEVLSRVVERNKFSNTGNVRIIEDCKNHELLAITDPTKPVVNWRSVLSLIDRKGGYDVRYDNGIITSMHSLSSDLDVKVGGEDHKQRISVHTPIDGYGSPAVYLALLRQVCSNGMVAMSKAFKTSINIGKKDTSTDIEFSLERMFDSFSNDEGFDALIRRLDAARASRLSVREFEQAQRFMARLVPPKDENNPLRISEELRKFSNMAGSLHLKYGLSHLQQMTDKQMSLLETDMTVYEAINYLTEVTTHRLSPENSTHNNINRSVQGWVGSLIAKPYDLENTIDQCDVKSEFRDVYFADSRR